LPTKAKWQKQKQKRKGKKQNQSLKKTSKILSKTK
jgi:hypothetical protein